MVLRGWELRYNYYILTHYAAPAMLPTTNAVFSQLTVLLFDYCIFFCLRFPDGATNRRYHHKLAWFIRLHLTRG